MERGVVTIQESQRGGRVREQVVTCRAPRRRPRWDGERCGGFVARLPYLGRVVGLPRHSDQANPGNVVASCRSCGTLHEIEPVRRRRLARAGAP